MFSHRISRRRLSRRRKENGVIRMSLISVYSNQMTRTNLFMLLQILGAFEALPTLLTGVGFERNVNSNVTSDMVTFGGFCGTGSPTACQAQIVCRFASNVFLTQMILHVSYHPNVLKYIEICGVRECFCAVTPLTRNVLRGRHFRWRFHFSADVRGSTRFRSLRSKII